MNQKSAIQRNLETAVLHHRAGRLAEAEKLYRQVLDTHPKEPDALFLLGLLTQGTRRYAESVEFFQRSIAVNPRAARNYVNLGLSIGGMGLKQNQEAIAAYRQAIALDPNIPEAWNNLGNELRNSGDFEQAMKCYREALRLKPGFADAQCNLGVAIQESGGLLDDALQAYEEAVRLDPAFAKAKYNFGVALHEKTGSLSQAVATYEKAIAMQPDFALAHWNLSFARLLLGDFERGWPEYEWRWKVDSMDKPRPFPKPMWDGGDLKGKRILLHAEQGYGDAIQMARYVPILAARGAKIILECPQLLARLFESLDGSPEIVVNRSALPDFDLHCPIMSLPLLTKTTLENLPKSVPYLKADASMVERWSRMMPETSDRLRVGLVWAGRPENKNDANRSVRLDQLEPISRGTNARFFSLQKGSAAGQARTPPAGMEIIDLTEHLEDFADTAAMMSHLDLVIAVDTAVAHLAGALGKPVWVLIPFSPDWRWMIDREDSPWYPTLRLLRQKTRGDWAEVIERVATALRDDFK